MSALLLVLPIAFITGGLLVLSYLTTPVFRTARIKRAHAREMRSMRGLLGTAPPVEYAGR